jgi:hypothetical protein
VNYYFKEFRDRAIFKCAQNYFKTYDAKMEASIQKAIKENSILLIHNAFDEVGTVKADHEKWLMQEEVGIIDLEPTERRDILGMMLQVVGNPNKGKQNKDEYTLSTRILVLDFLNDYNYDLLAAARKKAEKLIEIDWDYLVPDGIGWDQRLKLCGICNKIDSYHVSISLLNQLKNDQGFCKEFYEELVDVRVECDHVLADCLENTGKGEVAFEIRKNLINDLQDRIIKGDNSIQLISLFYDASKEIAQNDSANQDGYDFGELFGKAAEYFVSFYEKLKKNRKNPKYLKVAIECWNRKLVYDNEESAPYIEIDSFRKAKRVALAIYEGGKNNSALLDLFFIYKNAANVFCGSGKYKAAKKAISRLTKVLKCIKNKFKNDLIEEFQEKLEKAKSNF